MLEQGVTRSQAHVADVRERFNAGLVPPNEIASAEAQESRSRMLLIQARMQRDVSGSELARLVGVPPEQRVEPTEELSAVPPIGTPLPTLVAATRLALELAVMAEEARLGGGQLD